MTIQDTTITTIQDTSIMTIQDTGIMTIQDTGMVGMIIMDTEILKLFSLDHFGLVFQSYC